MFKPRITDDVKAIIENYIFEGATAVDLTAGNGYDTLFLAEGVGQEGAVYSFDVQQIAIDNTRSLIEKNGFLDRVKLIKAGHEDILEYINCPLDIAMMNLGYLPSGDKGVITKPETSVKAIEETLSLMKVGGIISILLYYGHEGGEDEKKAVEEYLHHLDSKYVDVLTISYSNRGGCPPIHKLIKKRSL